MKYLLILVGVVSIFFAQMPTTSAQGSGIGGGILNTLSDLVGSVLGVLGLDGRGGGILGAILGGPNQSGLLGGILGGGRRDRDYDGESRNRNRDRSTSRNDIDSDKKTGASDGKAASKGNEPEDSFDREAVNAFVNKAVNEKQQASQASVANSSSDTPSNVTKS